MSENNSTFKIMGINHLGIASKDPKKTSEFFSKLLSLPFIGEEEVKEQKTNTIMFNSSKNSSTEGAKLEILEPTDESSPISKYLEKKGAGIHHLALTVDNIENAIQYMIDHDVRMVDSKPRGGAHNTKIAFIHPASTGGILIELVENSRSSE